MDLDESSMTDQPTPNPKKRGRSVDSPSSASKIPPEQKEIITQSTKIVGLGVTAPSLPGSRVKVALFKKAMKAFEKSKIDCLNNPNIDINNVDIDCSELRYKSPTDIVSEAIERVMNDPNLSRLSHVELLSRNNIPDYEELVERERSCQLEAIKHVDFIRSRISKVRNKQINYIPKSDVSDPTGLPPSDFIDVNNDLILSVSIYQPKSNIKTQEFLVLASQKIVDLRDVIYCIQDQSVPHHHKNYNRYILPGNLPRISLSEAQSRIENEPPSEDEDWDSSWHTMNPNPMNAANRTNDESSNMDEVEKEKQNANKEPTSSFFFIDNTFYNDLRNPANVDYSETIIDWIESGESQYWSSRSVDSKKMEETNFDDLIVQIHKRYLYCHKGSCEHSIEFTSIRAVTDKDEMKLDAYPRQIFQSKLRHRRCMICDKFVAKLVTTGDNFAIEDPSYFCERCYEAAHYDTEGKLIHSGFQVFPYLHD